MNTIKQPHSRIIFKIASDAAQISPLAEAIQALCLYVTDSEFCAIDVQWAVVEALNNVILHAYNNQEDKEITLIWQQENRHIAIEIIDQGLSMATVPAITLPPPDTESGRGWWIISACMDEYHYKIIECVEIEKGFKPAEGYTYFENLSVKSHSNVLTLVKYF